MKHLSETELVDLLEGELAAPRRAHLDGCETCLNKYASLRGAMAETRDAAVPEPSPLFWDHLSARISNAVASGDEVPRQRWMPASFRTLTAAWLAAACVALLLTGAAFWRATMAGDPVRTVPHSDVVQAGPVADDLDDDAEWAIVRAVASDLQWEEAQAAGMSARPGSAERLIHDMSAEERAELARLLEEELERTGA